MFVNARQSLRRAGTRILCRDLLLSRFSPLGDGSFRRHHALPAQFKPRCLSYRRICPSLLSLKDLQSVLRVINQAEDSNCT